MSEAVRIGLLLFFGGLLGTIVTWNAQVKLRAKKLSYSYSIEPILRSKDINLTTDLKIFYKNEELPEPTLLSLDLVNTGYISVQNVKFVVTLPGSTYLIPGYFVDVPDGYDTLWDIKREDAEKCVIKLEHINPKQVARVRLLMDERPKEEPRFSCPMANVKLTQTSLEKVSKVARIIIMAIAPQLFGALLRK